MALTLLEAIDDSAAAIVIFSSRYAESWWCLEELAKICECPNKLILPVFHRVDSLDVRLQVGPFEEHFRVHEKERPYNKVLKWKRAMGKVGGLKRHGSFCHSCFYSIFISSSVEKLGCRVRED